MADKTTIEWTESSWNPIIAIDRESGKRGWACVKVSHGCTNCYAETLNKRLGTGRPYAAQETRNIEIRLAKGGQSGIDWPLRAKKPRLIFVCSMTDLFADFVPDSFIEQIFDVMTRCPQHTFQILTKRAERMQQFFHPPYSTILPNVWLGVSVENQETLHRLDHLRATPAAVRFVSFEPLLEDLGDVDLTGIAWVIVGGESGPGARPMHPDWARSVRDQCQAAGVPFFMKQDSGPKSGKQGRIPDDIWFTKEYPNGLQRREAQGEVQTLPFADED